MARRPQQLRVNALRKNAPHQKGEAELALPALRLRKDASPQRAEREAGRIFAKAGLRTVCLECPSGAVPPYACNKLELDDAFDSCAQPLMAQNKIGARQVAPEALCESHGNPSFVREYPSEAARLPQAIPTSLSLDTYSIGRLGLSVTFLASTVSV
jgi:hypothetical protein